MAAYAQLITHTPEQLVKWRGLATSNPSRLVRVLGLGPGKSTREGDNQGDIYAALNVLKEITRPFDSSGAKHPAWDGLVEAGVAAMLCKNVLEMVVFLDWLPTMPKDLLEKAKKEIQSPYHLPLEILCSASCCFEYPPSSGDKKVISALRRNWAQMMDRIWNEPENTLEPSNSHILERMAVAQMTIRLIITDPSCLAIFHDPVDLTIPIIARNWRYATDAADTKTNASVLNSFFYPEHPRHVAYVRSTSALSASQWLSRIYLGAGPSPTSSAPRQAKAIITTFGEHFARVVGIPAHVELDFFMGLLTAANRDNTEPELAKAILKSNPFWNGIFKLLRKSGKYEGSEGGEEPEEGKESRMTIAANVVGTATDILHKVYLESPRESEGLVRIWTNENLFGALEETIGMLVPMPGITMQISRMTGVIGNIVIKGAPALTRVLKDQFPRWRIIGTLLKHDIMRQQVVGPPPPVSSGKLPPKDSGVWDHSAWQCVLGLQSSCFDLGKSCGKRGCGKDGMEKESCAKCKLVLYCSEACRTKDAVSHEFVCPFMVVLVGADQGTKATPPMVPKPGVAPPSASKSNNAPLADLD
ncbi:hypothetical protein Hypma_012656 [Hypsizygus marmoreus]|uniref:MYND-type domain-containing protein n=1 Tax=Hypsizygus marmoreus TaxID=39966 RepID=A0A369JLM1_HYPMA|nr:hypothetical protein Hypma_012656 [Hypsizygus marmoreus]